MCVVYLKHAERFSGLLAKDSNLITTIGSLSCQHPVPAPKGIDVFCQARSLARCVNVG